MKKMERWAALTQVVLQGEKTLGASGHTLIQKLFYLLQEAKDYPLGYRFKLYHYGPYCAELWGDLNTLAELGYLTIQPKGNGQGYQITTTDLGRELVREYRAGFEGLGSMVDELLALLGGEPVRRLETLATTFYVCKDWRQKGITPKDERVIASVRNLKPHLTEQEVAVALVDLARAGLLH